MSSLRGVSDPAGWYPDPTTRHELRYWDGAVWLDNVSDSGAAASDPLGGKPMPPPSEAAAKAQQGPPPAAKSKIPIYVGAAAGVLVVAVVAFLVTRGGDNETTKVTDLGDDVLTISDKGESATTPAVHSIRIKDNTVVIIEVKTDTDLTPGIIVETGQGVVDEVNNRISGVSDRLTNQLKNACSNLRETDLGAKGSVAYFFEPASGPGETLRTFTIAPVGGEFEFIPVLVGDDGNCKGGQLELTLDPHFLDFSQVSDFDALASLIADDPELAEFTS